MKEALQTIAPAVGPHAVEAAGVGVQSHLNRWLGLRSDVCQFFQKYVELAHFIFPEVIALRGVSVEVEELVLGKTAAFGFWTRYDVEWRVVPAPATAHDTASSTQAADTHECMGDTGEWKGDTGECMGDTGEWLDDTGEWLDDTGEWMCDTGEWLDDTGEWMDNTGEWMGDTGEWMGDMGEWMGDTGEWLDDTGEWMGDMGEWMGDTGEWMGDSGEWLDIMWVNE